MRVVFFFNDTATTEIYTLSLHDALPISPGRCGGDDPGVLRPCRARGVLRVGGGTVGCGTRVRRPAHCDDSRVSRSEEHTSELQSRQYLVCRLLLEKKTKLSKPLWCTARV